MNIIINNFIDNLSNLGNELETKKSETKIDREKAREAINKRRAIQEGIAYKLLTEEVFHDDAKTHLSIRELFYSIVRQMQRENIISNEEASFTCSMIINRNAFFDMDVPPCIKFNEGLEKLWKCTDRVFDRTCDSILTSHDEKLAREKNESPIPRTEMYLEVKENISGAIENLQEDSLNALNLWNKSDLIKTLEHLEHSLNESLLQLFPEGKRLCKNQQKSYTTEFFKNFGGRKTIQCTASLIARWRRVHDHLAKKITELNSWKHSPGQLKNKIEGIKDLQGELNEFRGLIDDFFKCIDTDLQEIYFYNKTQNKELTSLFNTLMATRQIAENFIALKHCIETIKTNFQIIHDNMTVDNAYDKLSYINISEWSEPRHPKPAAEPVKPKKAQKPKNVNPRPAAAKKENAHHAEGNRQVKQKSRSRSNSNEKTENNEKADLTLQEVQKKRMRKAYHSLKARYKDNHLALACFKQMKHSLMHAATGYELFLQQINSGEHKAIPQTVSTLIFDLHSSIEQLISSEAVLKTNILPPNHKLEKIVKTAQINGLSPTTNRILGDNNEGTIYLRYPNACAKKFAHAVPEALKLNNHVQHLLQNDPQKLKEDVTRLYIESMAAFDEIAGKLLDKPFNFNADSIGITSSLPSAINNDNIVNQQLTQVINTLKNWEKKPSFPKEHGTSEMLKDAVHHLQCVEQLQTIVPTTYAAKAKKERDMMLHLQTAIELTLSLISCKDGRAMIVDHDLNLFLPFVKNEKIHNELLKFSVGGAFRYPKFRTETHIHNSMWVEESMQARKYANHVAEDKDGVFVEPKSNGKLVKQPNLDILSQVLKSGLSVMNALIQETK